MPSLWESLRCAEDWEMVKSGCLPPGSPPACGETGGSCYQSRLHRSRRALRKEGIHPTCEGSLVKEACESALEDWIRL